MLAVMRYDPGAGIENRVRVRLILSELVDELC